MRTILVLCLTIPAFLGASTTSLATTPSADNILLCKGTSENQARQASQTDRYTSVVTLSKRGPASGGCIPGEVVRVTDAWIRQPPPGARMLAGYLTIKNDTPDKVALQSATCDGFEEVQIHTVKRDSASGLVRMVQLRELVIPANQMLVMTPGHDHLMLIGPKRDVQTGEKVNVKLFFSNGFQTEISAEVRGRAKPAS
jgi:copper(I)-binding protein